LSSTRTKKKSVLPVAFVGSGPGDPGLLTVRGAEVIATADVVLHDAGVPPEVLARVGPDAEVVDVSGPEGSPTTTADRAKAAVERARAGKRVARVLVGDPAFDGVLAGEAAALAKAKVPFELVPGVSTIASIPAYAGVPVTGAKASEVRVIDVTAAHIDWESHATSKATTLVLLNAVPMLAQVVSSLVEAGAATKTPISVTRGGGTTDQRTVASTLETIVADAKAAGLTVEGTVVVGDAVSVRDKLSWFESRPIFGWRVLVPRTKEQAGALSAQLVRHGGVPVEVPTISVEPPRTPQQMERAVHGLVSGRYQWVAFTSANAVRAVREKFEEYGLDARAFAGIKVAAIGESTAAALKAFGVNPDLVPKTDQSSVGLLEEWPPYDDLFDPINRVFLPRADIATETLVAGLVELGWEVDDVTAYRTVRAAPPPAATREAIKSGGFDAVLFTSSSTVRNLIGIAGKPHTSTVVACIGPQTAKTAEEHGLRVDVLAPNPSVESLAEALAEHGESLRLAAVEAGELAWRPSEKRASARRKAK
jgi:uroporphyrinogen III methyltransferase/synthase